MFYWFSKLSNGFLVLRKDHTIVGPFPSARVIKRDYPNAEACYEQHA